MRRQPRSPLTRYCDHCGTAGQLSHVLTCTRGVYAYRWLCRLCAARRSRRGGTRA